MQSQSLSQPTTQQNYAREIEDSILSSLINQFNSRITQSHTHFPHIRTHIVILYVNRPAGFIDLSAVLERFIGHCELTGWHVKSLHLDECKLTISVIHRHNPTQ